MVQKRFGCHIGLKTTLHQTVKVGLDSFCTSKTFQCFLAAKTSYNCRVICKEDKIKVNKYCTDKDLSLYVHAPYVTNLAAKDPSSAQSCLRSHFEATSTMPMAVVLHVGNAKQGGNIQSVVEGLDSVNVQADTNWKQTPFRLLFENSAGQGNDLGSSIDELRLLFEAFGGDDLRGKQNVGVCIDTCHAFASGMYDLSHSDKVIEMFDQIDPIGMIHLNDSLVDFNKKVDRHATLRQGYIYKEDEGCEALKSLLTTCVDKEIDVILETPSEGHLKDLDLMFCLVS